jgi:hypothetical protein
MLSETLLGPSSKLSEYFRPAAYTKIIRDICDSSVFRETATEWQYVRAMMLLAAHLTLARHS